jgi:diphthine synthase
MLYLIGTGISLDLTLEGLTVLKQCEEVYLESYTNPLLKEKINEIERMINKKINVIERKEVESDFLIKKAKKKNVALLSSGDPLTATTHVALLLDGRKEKIEVKVIHNSSIYTAAPGKAGLQIYRFGRTATLVNPQPNYKPTSSLDVIRANISMNMHTLVLLDTEPQPMEAKTALQMLSEFKEAVVLSRLGEKDERIIYGRIEDLRKEDLGKPPFSIIIPAKLHPIEEEYLKAFSFKK